jgi:hypothetical protein
MDIQANIKWYIVDGIVYELDSPGISRPEGENHVVVSKQVPYSILPGKYNMRIEATYQVHPLHKEIINTWNTPTFTVLDADECPLVPDENQSFSDPINRPIDTPSQRSVEEKSSVETINPGTSHSTTVVTEQRSEPQVSTPEPEKTPIKDLIEGVVKPIQGLL